MAMPLLMAFCSSVNAQEVTTVTEGQTVDLGLSVNWAGWNIGANSPEETGGLYGWADPTGERTSTDFSDYPSATPPDNISGTEYDIAIAKWGAEWRMPTVEETKELSEKCTWEWTEYKSVMGMMVTGPNGNCIFLPAAASRTGENVSNQVGKRGCYWTGTLYPGNSNFADYLYFYDNGHFGDRNTRRYIGHSVRAVTAEHSGIESVTADGKKYNISVNGYNMTVNGVPDGQTIDVFNLQGQTIYSGKDNSVTLPTKGVYIVRIDENSQKIIL